MSPGLGHEEVDIAAEKQVGASAGILALLAFLFHMFMPPSSEQGSKSSGAGTTVEGRAERKAEGADKPVPVQGPWMATRQYFHQERPRDFRSPCIDYLLPPNKNSTTCHPAELRELFGLEKGFESTQLTTVIATIPDPLHTRLSLTTDRDLDAIQEGAFESGWEMATQWLPWAAKASQISDGRGSGIEAHLDLEDLPGLIVFRRHFTAASEIHRLLFVFLAGETPTAGIDGFQFEAARRCIRRLNDPRRISILGPSFSGSFMSLAKLIKADTDRGYDIQSGHVSNSTYANSMLEALAGRKDDVRFHSNTIPSVSFEQQFQTLQARHEFKDLQVAELVEDESGFSYGVQHPINGGEHAAEQSQVTAYRYPRDIAQLRNAYRDNAFGPPAAAGSTPAPAVPLLLKDTQSGESDFPLFSTSHTPVSQDAIFETIARTLKRDKVRLLSVSATNIFDTLFLVTLLAHECPDLRAVLNGADLLFAQEATQNSLSGTLAISSFPMFSEGFDWANNGHEATTFPDSDSVGEYNAIVSLLCGDQRVGFGPRLNGNPSFSSDWLLVLGRDGWAPVDLLAQGNPILFEKGEPTWFDPNAAPVANNDPDRLSFPPLSRGWVILCMLTACPSFFICARFLYLRGRPDKRTWSAFCSIDLKRGGSISRLAHLRYLCFFGCFSSLVLLNGVLLIPMMESVKFGAAQGVMWVAFLLPFGTAWYLDYLISGGRQYVSEKSSYMPSKRYSRGMSYLRRVVLALPLGFLFFWFWLCFDAGARGTFFRFRVQTLVIPISPVWPLLLGSAAFFLITFFHLRRLTWADRQRPLLETSLIGAALGRKLQEAGGGLARAFSGPVDARLSVGSAGVASGALLIILFREDSLRSFESNRYEWLVISVFLPVSLFVVAGFMHFAYTWRLLRDLLTILSSVDLRRFFGPLTDFDGGGPVWIRDLKMLSLATSVNSFISLHNLRVMIPTLSLDPMQYWNAWCYYDSSERVDRLEMQRAYRKFFLTGSYLTRLLHRAVLLPFWQEARIPFVQTGSVKPDEVRASDEKMPMAAAAAAGSSSSLFTKIPELIKPDPPKIDAEAYEMAARYVTLQFSVFIAYALRHIQNLLLCSVLSFAFLVMALNSFSFQMPQLISYVTLVALAVGGTIIVRVLAQIERNPIISRMSGTEEGALSMAFYLRVLTYGGLPVVTVLATQFPALTRLLSSWAQPAIDALK